MYHIRRTMGCHVFPFYKEAGTSARAILLYQDQTGLDIPRAIKIPLKSGHYYLVENRQPIGFDRVLPDSGILILEVNPNAVEGSGTVKVMDADPDSPNFSHATFRADRKNRNVFIDRKKILPPCPLGQREVTKVYSLPILIGYRMICLC